MSRKIIWSSMPKKTILSPPKLDTLPKEILRIITAYLPPPSAASLAFTSHHTLSVLGTQYFWFLNKPPNFTQRLLFLELLEHRFPNHILCPTCAIYHLRTPSQSLIPPLDLTERREKIRVGEKEVVKYPWIDNTSTTARTDRGGCPINGSLRFQAVIVVKGDFVNWTVIHSIAKGARLGPSYGISIPPSTQLHTKWSIEREWKVLNDTVIAKVTSSTELIVRDDGDGGMKFKDQDVEWNLEGEVLKRYVQTLLSSSSSSTPPTENLLMQTYTSPFSTTQISARLSPTSPPDPPQKRNESKYTLTMLCFTDFGEACASNRVDWWHALGFGTVEGGDDLGEERS